ncbi:MAG: RiPP maturation radical SAM protein 1 [Deltaproteobacteria bacterium]|nr:RiPP maturation radical SAM protein 1 [Deltaproteobacteria bacterium]
MSPASTAPSFRAGFPVALVAMPFSRWETPSIQVALLEAIAAAHGYPATSFHFNLDFAAEIGPDVFSAISLARAHLLGDWLFARAAFGALAPDEQDSFLELASEHDDRRLGFVGVTREKLRQIRHEVVPAFVDRLAREVPWADFRVVGFTSTFQQNAASFALAAAIKRRHPSVVTVFGGVNFEAEMGRELVRTIDCIDLAVVGEGDTAFPELLDALREGRDPADVAGVVLRRGGAVTPLRRRPPTRLDDLPVPDYAEYFERSRRLGLLRDDRAVRVPFESSRGCWWGQKHPCTFCGQNVHQLRYRSKSPARVASEVRALASLHAGVHLEVVDSILDMSYFRDLLPRLAAESHGASLSVEVKANLSRVQIGLLRDAGAICLQPGIESLSAHVLELMQKGVTPSQNVNTLRWARYFGLEVAWNVLWGFPGETEDDYREQAALIPLLRHLEPPGGNGRFWMARFSPVFADRSRFGATLVRPAPAYSRVYPRGVDLEKVAYFFDHAFEDRLPDSTYDRTKVRIEAWRAAWQRDRRPRMEYRAYPGFVVVEDAREPDKPAAHTLEGLAGRLYLACSDHARTAATAAETTGASLAEVEGMLRALCHRGLTMRDGARYLSLAIPSARPRYTERNGRLVLSLSADPDVAGRAIGLILPQGRSPSLPLAPPTEARAASSCSQGA